jgi:hypothetical protein
MDQYFIFAILYSIVLPALPFMAVEMIGLILAFVRRKRHPNVSLLAGILFSYRLVMSIIGLWSQIVITYNINYGSGSAYAGLQSTWGLWSFLLNIIAFVVFLYAIFGWREEKLPPLTEILTQK